MPGIGDLVVNLSANTQKFDKNISKSQGGLKDFASSAVSLLNPVTASLVAITGAAVGVGAAIWGLQGRIGDLAGVADKAAQTGLSGAFLQQLEFAADQSGVSAETLTGGIKKLTVMIGKAADGNKEASETLKEFGLNAKELQKLSPEQQFLKISEAIGKIPTASGRAAAAVKIFGKSGIEMTTLFAGGLDDITKLMQDAKDIGIGLDDEQLKRVADADDALQKMYASIGAMVDQVAVGLAPSFEKVAENVTGLIAPVTKLFDTFNNMDDRWKWLGDTMVASFDVAIEQVKLNFRGMLNDLKDEAVGAVNFFEDITNPVGVAGQIAGGLIGNGQQAVNPNAGLQDARERLNGLLGQFNGARDGNREAPTQPGFNRQWMELKPPKSFTEAWTGITDALSPITSQLESGARGFVDRTKIQAGAIAGTLTGWLGTDRKKQQDMTPRLAGAMAGGGVDAYSTIVQAMMTRGKDPVVAATEKQTKELIKGLKPKREFKNIESFVSL